MAKTKSNYDVTEVIRTFLTVEGGDRAQLFAEFTQALNYPAAPQRLLVAEVAQACLEQPGCTPEITVRIAINYGLVLGVLLEKERAGRRELILQ